MSFIGLTEIKIFGDDYEEIKLTYADLSFFKNNQVKNTSNLPKLINNNFQTNDQV